MILAIYHFVFSLECAGTLTGKQEYLVSLWTSREIPSHQDTPYSKVLIEFKDKKRYILEIFP